MKSISSQPNAEISLIAELQRSPTRAGIRNDPMILVDPRALRERCQRSTIVMSLSGRRAGLRHTDCMGTKPTRSATRARLAEKPTRSRCSTPLKPIVRRDGIHSREVEEDRHALSCRFHTKHSSRTALWRCPATARPATRAGPLAGRGRRQSGEPSSLEAASGHAAAILSSSLSHSHFRDRRSSRRLQDVAVGHCSPPQPQERKAGRHRSRPADCCRWPQQGGRLAGPRAF